ncbi:MAG: peptidase U37, partial [Alphaproteobacteria bacterium]
MPDHMIDLPLQTRAASLVPGTANAEARSVELVWSTGATVRRRDWMSGDPYDEVLVLDAGACDLTRLNAGAPFLDTHGARDLSSVIGVVERAWIAEGVNGPEGRALVRFSDRPDVEPIWRDVAAGIVRNVSVGYAVRAYEITDAPVPIWRAVDWQPAELSAVPIGADPGAGFRSAPATHPCHLVHRQESPMADEVPITDQPVSDPEPAAAAPPPAPPAPPPDPSVVAERAVATERTRIAGIYDAQGKLGVARSIADGLVTRGVALDDARRVLIDEAAKVDGTRETRAILPMHASGMTPMHAFGMTVPGGQDEKATRRAAIEGALLHRFNPSANKLDGPAGEWCGLTLLEMARAVLDAEGERTRGLSRDEVATRSLHAGSDFPRILAGVAGKTLRQAYEATPRTFLPFCRQVTSPDFKDVHRVQLGEAPSLVEVKENGEITRGSIGEGEEIYRLKSYGRIFGVTRQAIINDDLGAFTRVPQMFGNAAARLEG